MRTDSEEWPSSRPRIHGRSDGQQLRRRPVATRVVNGGEAQCQVANAYEGYRQCLRSEIVAAIVARNSWLRTNAVNTKNSGSMRKRYL